MIINYVKKDELGMSFIWSCRMEQMRKENSELTNRLTEAAMRVSEAEMAHEQERRASAQATPRASEPPVVLSNSRPSSPHSTGSAPRPCECSIVHETVQRTLAAWHDGQVL